MGILNHLVFFAFGGTNFCLPAAKVGKKASSAKKLRYYLDWCVFASSSVVPEGTHSLAGVWIMFRVEWLHPIFCWPTFPVVEFFNEFWLDLVCYLRMIIFWLFFQVFLFVIHPRLDAPKVFPYRLYPDTQRSSLHYSLCPNSNSLSNDNKAMRVLVLLHSMVSVLRLLVSCQ